MQAIQRYAMIDYMGTWNIGAFIASTNRFTIIGEGFRPQVKEDIARTLNTEVIVQRIYGEDIVGCLIVASSNGVIVPFETYDHEVKALKERLDVNVEKVRFYGIYSNALGNILLINEDRGVIHSKIYRQNRATLEKIEDTLGIEICPVNIEFTDALASYIVVNSNGIVFSPLFKEEEIEEIRKFFGFSKSRAIVATINMGNPIVRSGCIANDKGLLVGNRTTGIELARIYNALLG